MADVPATRSNTAGSGADSCPRKSASPGNHGVAPPHILPIAVDEAPALPSRRMSAMSETWTRRDDAPGDSGSRRDFLTLVLRAPNPAGEGFRWPLDGRPVVLGRGPEVALVEGGGSWRLTVPDRWMSSRHALLSRHDRGWHLEDLGSKNETFVNGARISSVPVGDGDVLEIGSTFFVLRAGQVSPRPQGQTLSTSALAAGPAAFATFSPALARAVVAVRRAAATDVPILILGASGTGKELLAQAVHDASARTGRFVAVNCAAIPEALIEGELFGYRKGAFSGADGDHPGLIRAADHGTLFLDEVAELRAPAQAALLRALQEREVRPLGTTQAVPVDFRVIAATHRDLDAAVAMGAFREDLYARLAGVRAELPALGERPEDLGLMIQALLRGILGTESGAASFELEAARALMLHHWPRNVRELEQALRAALAVSSTAKITRGHLPADIGRRERGPVDHDAGEARVVDLLRRHRGNVSAIAREMQTSRGQVRRVLRRLGLEADAYR